MPAVGALSREELRLERSIMADSLAEFFRGCWHVIEPGKPLTWGWHLDAIAEHLEAVTANQIQRLLIAIPPRMTKSSLVAVAWQPWAWIRQPSLRFMFGSYSRELATTHCEASRALITSDWYTDRWGDKWGLTLASKRLDLVQNTRRGVRRSVGIQASITGKGGDILVLDDPHNLAEVYSSVFRAKVREFYRTVWLGRMDDPKATCEVCIMQRAHAEDLAGMLQEDYGYEALVLPNEYDPQRRCTTSIGWSDPRTTEGELLCEERLDRKATIQKKIAKRAYQTQYQQDPEPDDGELFKREYLPTIAAKELPALEDMTRVATVRAWDCAASTKEEGAVAWTAGVRMTRLVDERYVIEDVIRRQFSPGSVDTLIRTTAARDGRHVRIGEEQEPGSSGKSVVDVRGKALRAFAYRAYPKSASKEAYWHPVAACAENGGLFLVEADWNEEFITELVRLPTGRTKDMADAAALAFYILTQARRRASTAQVVGG